MSATGRVISTTHRKWYACKEVKPLDDFTLDRGRLFGRRYECRECSNAKHPLRKAANPQRHLRNARTSNYHRRGLEFSGADYERLNAEQQGLCAICHRPETQRHQNGGVKGLAVDHDHATGKIRALLCAWCNKGLGLFREDPELMAKAIAYLKSHS